VVCKTAIGGSNPPVASPTLNSRRVFIRAADRPYWALPVMDDGVARLVVCQVLVGELG
jgi:hypothetical protein